MDKKGSHVKQPHKITKNKCYKQHVTKKVDKFNWYSVRSLGRQSYRLIKKACQIVVLVLAGGSW